MDVNVSGESMPAEQKIAAQNCRGLCSQLRNMICIKINYSRAMTRHCP